MTPEQCRSACDLLGWTSEDLAWNSAVSETALRQMGTEAAHSLPEPVLAVLYRVFRAAGVEFSFDGGHGPDVRLRGKPVRSF